MLFYFIPFYTTLFRVILICSTHLEKFYKQKWLVVYCFAQYDF
jgi:hypothetical protein